MEVQGQLQQCASQRLRPHREIFIRAGRLVVRLCRFVRIDISWLQQASIFVELLQQFVHVNLLA